MTDNYSSQPEPPQPGPPPNPNPPTTNVPPAAYGAYQPAVGYGPAPLGLRRSAGLVILLTIVTCGFYSMFWSYQVGNELQVYRRQGMGGLVYLLFTAFISPVTMFLLPGEIEQAYNEMGQPSPVSTMTGLWFLLPIAGNFVWYLQVQSALNDYWTMLGQTNDPGL